jgi:hypothetical protein
MDHLLLATVPVSLFDSFSAQSHEFIVTLDLPDDAVRSRAEPHVLEHLAVDSVELPLAVDANHCRAHQIGLRLRVSPSGRIGSLRFEKHE